MLKFLSLFRSRNKKKKEMASLSELSIEEIQGNFSPMEFEWIKGDYASSHERFKNVSFDGENKFIIFMSGRRINIDLLDEFMIYFPAPPDQPKQVNNQPQQQRSSSVTAILYDDVNTAAGSEDSPIYKLLKKQKKNPVEVAIKLKLNLPSKDLFGVLSSSFEDAEKEIINFVLDGVDIEDIKLALAESIKKNYYLQGQSSKPEKQNAQTPAPPVKKRTEQIDESEA